MRIFYHELYDFQFEKLVVVICQKILGIGVQEFSQGPDGGRDARFDGRATLFPSETAPLEGKCIIQAKHTNGINEKFSDKAFSGTQKSSVLSGEIPKIVKLFKRGELDHYLLFSNRKLTADAEETIRKRLQKETGVESINLFDIDRCDRYLKTFPDITKIVGISPMDYPLNVSPGDLAHVILAFSKQISGMKIPKIPQEIRRKEFGEKNVINNLTEVYAKEIQKEYLLDFPKIKKFLGMPENKDVLEKYQSASEEFKFEIISHRKDYQTFDQVLNYLYKHLIDRDCDLRERKRLTRTMLFYMYWNCDIGTENNA